MARVVFFSSDLTETAQIRRIRSFVQAGHSVASVSMRKPGGAAALSPDWPDLALGEIAEQQLGQRLRLILRGLPRIWAGRRHFDGAELLVARNIDMVLLAWLVRIMLWARLPIVYECLDIHSLFTAPGRKAAVARWVERRMLGRIALLVLSSPGFARNYFIARQGYRGSWYLLENKLWFAGPPLPRPTGPGRQRGTGAPLVLGWVGAIRCGPSLDILLDAATRAQGRLQVTIRGVIHRHALPDIDARIAANPHVTYGGPYDYPDGLVAVYGACDLVWAQDLWQRGANSDWLLPNRIYEASWFGCPSIAVAGTETAAKVAALGLGMVLDKADGGALWSGLAEIDATDLAALRASVLACPNDALRLTPAEIDGLVAAALTQTRKAAP